MFLNIVYFTLNRFLKDHQKISTAHAIMLCSGKQSATKIFEMQHHPPTEDDDKQFEDSAVFGTNTYLSLVVKLLSDLGRLLGGGDGGGGGGNQKLKQELQEMITLKEAAEAEKEAAETEKVSADILVTTLQEELTRTRASSEKVQHELVDMTALRKVEQADKEKTTVLMGALREELKSMTAKEKKMTQQLTVCERAMETMSRQEMECKREISVTKDNVLQLKQQNVNLAAQEQQQSVALIALQVRNVSLLATIFFFFF